MDLKESERQVLAGEITDFEPYFEDGSLNYHLRYILAKNNIEVDRIIEMDGPGTILGFIKDKVHVNRYEEWKDYPVVYIRQALARAGYFEDEYFDDSDESVRGIVIQNNVRKALTHIRSDNDLAIIRYELENIVDIDIDILIAYTNKLKQWARKYNSNYNENCEDLAFQLKLDAINYIPKIIEKTMNEVQLFESGCPLWTAPYTPRQVYKILLAEKRVKCRGYNNFTQVLFDAFHKKEHSFHPGELDDFIVKLLNERN